MCGISGYITTDRLTGGNHRKGYMEDALVTGMLRGFDSSGTFAVPFDNKRNVKILHSTGTGVDLVASTEYNKMFGALVDIENHRIMVGHNRAATRGSVALSNTHPFNVGAVTLVHNGTLHRWDNLPLTMASINEARPKKSPPCAVDSHVVAHNMNHFTDPRECIALLDGAFALVWHDSRTRLLHVIRNDNRPLHFAGCKNHNTVLFASEVGMLTWLTERNHIDIGHICQPDPGVLMTFKEDSIVPTLEKVELYKPKVTYHNTGNQWVNPNAGGVSTVNIPFVVRGGKKKDKTKVPSNPLPAGALADLALLEVQPDGMLEFMPTSVEHQKDKGYAIVKGISWLPNKEVIHATLPGLSSDGLQDVKVESDIWTCMPIGVSWSKKSGAPTLFLRLLAKRPIVDSGYSSEKPLQRSRLASKDLEDWFPGPDGAYISAVEWLDGTKDGCDGCGCALIADDADDLMWGVETTKDGQADVVFCSTCAIEQIHTDEDVTGVQ